MKKQRGVFTKEEAEAKKAPHEPGVYSILVNKYFKRIKGKTNVVYIGRGQDLFKRLVGPRKALYRFNALRDNGYCLSFRCEPTTTKDEAKILEKYKLREFENRHLELPSLNHSS